MIIQLSKSTRDKKKYMVIVEDKIIHFGASNYEDYTEHKDPERKQRYLARHRNRENWAKSGINTAGFWSRWLLWGEPTIAASINKIQKKFNVKINLSI